MMYLFFFFNHTATSEFYTLSLHDALPISFEMVEFKFHISMPIFIARQWIRHRTANVNEYSGRYSIVPDQFYKDRKSTRLNSSHLGISYAVFCLKKKKINKKSIQHKTTITS